MIKKLIVCVFTALLIGCSYFPEREDRNNYIVDHSYPYTTNQDIDSVRVLVLHYTALNDKRSIRALTGGEVSTHYLIPSQPKYEKKEPVIFQLVPENQKAWHAGKSEWNGYQNLNRYSIGIEIVNCGFKQQFIKKEWCSYHPSQIDAVIRLAKDVIQRYQIKAINVVGHSDIAPLRKEDPGPFFPWQLLYTQGIGAWPEHMTVNKYLAGRAPDTPASVISIQKALSLYGYSIPQTGILDTATRKTIQVFQMHFRPSDISGMPDAETEAIALALIEKYQ
ncbi:N-acetylmuramoyl-L-alanine amidase [Xenorhabdus nematophila]|uniref:N-acetylmuramoyl-L-alanine amidase n=1 Tax=Xenorhabdus nematophila (strain ATCC 19061 / DSM 3370 / CCUG 14189 / LMG 1036 / NCIMB 9965 / AN6) TaxID=406817 RepID=D3VIB0_XENNA|nr:N-acetylmuramoyl-L-alanine amidase [Xenorhabdus nematophila]CEE90182.1 putative amidase [Xenorhabdus nematophila str. Anatoliense]CEF30709.1 putative amidase [Xenorhabdus nematophila str. Websteri]AYA39965.1 N-acetylmuramoyl-L-alanine amidase [Xenorhabdus nematophila]KHD29154.1 N-acetylmuramoyl-L-alanine amidase [Xenorhabdus nematophila]MBA0018600.1 N-acetylmuramoyl-L-alanine amidase [Xenorhabdus nematophila]